MRQFIKKYIKKKLPHAVSIYHEYRNKQHYRNFKVKKTPFGFNFIGPPAMQDGLFEQSETAIFLEKVSNCEVFVDIGANVGYFVCIARNIGKKVIAIEPLKDNLNYLYENLRLNSWEDVEVFPMGMGDKPGVAELFGGGTGASLLAGWAGSSEVWKRTIALSTLDIVLGDRFVDSKMFIKIDVEGYEFEVLKGSLNTLSRKVKPIWLIEICFDEHYPKIPNPNYYNTFKLFWRLGYKSYTATDLKLDITENDLLMIQKKQNNNSVINYLFIYDED